MGASGLKGEPGAAGPNDITSKAITSNATSSWTGNPGTQGKIQYHSNRWYIVSDKASNRIVQFRRDGENKSYIDNNGKFVGTATNADALGGKAIGSFVRTDAGSNVSADTEWQDNKSIYLGSGADYRMYHNTNHHTYFQNKNHGKSTYFQSEDSTGNNRAMIYMDGGARPYVRLFEAGKERLRTTSVGVEIPGHLDITQAGDLVLRPSTSGGNANIVLFKNAAANSHGGPGSGKIADREHFRVHSQSASSHGAASGVPQGNNEGLLRPAYMVCDQLYFQNGKDLRTSSGGAGPVGSGGVKACSGWNGDFHTKASFVPNYSFSDERLKKNISNLDSKKSLDQINSLQGVNYEWKEGREGVQFGFIAQQVEKVFPEMISEHSRLGDGENGQLDERITWKRIREKQIVPLLVESVKELTDLVKKQQTQINELKSKIS